MTDAWPDVLARLRGALERFDAPEAARVVDEVTAVLAGCEPGTVPAEAMEVLGLLRRHRRFDLLERVADAVLRPGSDLATARRQYAQALIERGALVAALDVLQPLLRADGDAEEAVEARGLEGRVHKELFLAASPQAAVRRAEALARAHAAYAQVYRASPERVWHGINAAALLLRAERDGLAVPGVADPGAEGRAAAIQVAATVERRADRADPWDWTTALEADVALGRVDSALARLQPQHQAGRAGAFELASLRRQLVEVWQLSAGTAPGSWILPPLEALLLQKQGAVLTLEPDAGAPLRTPEAAFEKVFGAEGAVTQAWFEDLLRRCRAVARIEDGYEEPLGTGFLVDGADLHPSLGGVVMLTNAHVVPDAVPAQDAFVTFRGLRTADGTARVPVRRLLWTSPRDELDATVLELESLPDGVERCPLGVRMPPLGASTPSRVYVIGHPSGTPAVKVSIHDNALLDYDDVKAHYRAPTQPGSSGSPVFDRMWKVVALHHAGSGQMPRLHGPGVHEANEGIRLDRIRAALAGAPGAEA